MAKCSGATQLCIEGVPGWYPAFRSLKVGKFAATAVGGGLVLLHLADLTEYIKVDWQQVEENMKKAKEQLKIPKNKPVPTEVKGTAEEVVSFVKESVVVAGGLFLLGVAS